MTAVESRQGGARVWLPPPLVFLAGIGAGAAMGAYVRPWSVAVDGRVRLAAAAVVGLSGVALALSTLTLFHRTGQKPEPWKPSPILISQGPYRRSRNPMYLAMVLAQCGLGLLLDNLWVALWSLPVLIVVHYTAVLPEERYLTERFGQAYRDYCASVPRYLGSRPAAVKGEGPLQG